VFHVKHGYEALLDRLGIPVTAARVDRLERYEALLREHAVRLGMVGRSDADRLVPRHIADALRGTRLVEDAQDAIDLGSGAGLPGVPLAIACEGTAWGLVEPRRKRVAFLELVVAELRLSHASVIASTADRVPSASSDLVVARAFAPVDRTWAAAEPLLRADGRLLLWAGSSTEAAALALPGVEVRLVTSPVAEEGPIAIMSRQ
jgi:16S rRNA (guanine527-N7)-methyltransferase